jgi:hypothetical protein
VTEHERPLFIPVVLGTARKGRAYTAALEQPGAADPEFDGIVEEVHTCPACGAIRVRPVPRAEAP